MSHWKLKFPVYQSEASIKHNDRYYISSKTLGFFSYWLIWLIHGRRELEDMAAIPTLLRAIYTRNHEYDFIDNIFNELVRELGQSLLEKR